MAFYFVFALFAAYQNHKTDARQAMRLDNLHVNAANGSTHDRDSAYSSFPSSGLGIRAPTAPTAPDTSFGISFPEAAATSSHQPTATKSTRDGGPAESQSIFSNPFMDPENPFRGEVVNVDAATQDPETGGWR
jgi:hypothetical protein